MVSAARPGLLGRADLLSTCFSGIPATHSYGLHRVPLRGVPIFCCIDVHRLAGVGGQGLSGCLQYPLLGECAVRLWFATMLACAVLQTGLAIAAPDEPLECLLRMHTFNHAFEGFDYYSVTIEEDRPQTDGSCEVTAVASGRFLQSTKRLKILFLLVGNHIIGGQVLEEAELPPCLASEEPRTS